MRQRLVRASPTIAKHVNCKAWQTNLIEPKTTNHKQYSLTDAQSLLKTAAIALVSITQPMMGKHAPLTPANKIPGGIRGHSGLQKDIKRDTGSL
mmetsp:Transcript_78808/g.124320  ORF Transcript_78808/g.124320 Transcript_78808/m.124320 type:complete len:94 (-) Transcript_78808:1578-1859(-)